MKEEFLMVPSFWKCKLKEIQEGTASVKLGNARILASSAGRRDIPIVEYGEKEDFERKANYGSACGAGNPAFYARKGKITSPFCL